MNQTEFDRVYKKIKETYFAEISYWKTDKPYYDGLANAFKACKADVFEKAVKRHIEVASKTPTVANLREIMRSLNRSETNTTEHKTTSCKLCGGVGLISYYRWNHKTGFWCEYLCHCNCRNDRKYEGNSAFLTSGEVDELIRNNPFVRLNVPFGMHKVPPEEFEQALKNLPERKPSERAQEIGRKILRRKSS